MNEKIFKSCRSERKNFFFLVSHVLSFRHTKQTSKNVADTTFNIKLILELIKERPEVHENICYMKVLEIFD